MIDELLDMANAPGRGLLDTGARAAHDGNDRDAGPHRLGRDDGGALSLERGAVHHALTDDDEAVGPSPTALDGTPTPAADGPEPVPDPRVAAALCTDLCKVTGTNELPELLARAATLINATGIIIWVQDSSGHALRPAIGHGYSTRSLVRLGSLPEDGNNATAAAYRSAHMQVVERDDTKSGALAAPLLAANTCVGVLSAELRDGWESSEAVQATAAILAAQLATLLSADPSADTAVPPAEAHAHG